jgi:nucleoid-associated protein YgaU
VRKESKFLLISFILNINTSHVFSQDDISDKDLQNLLESDKSNGVLSEENKTVPVPGDEEATLESSSATSADESVSSETVDLSALENNDITPPEETANSAVDKNQENLEPLPPENSVEKSVSENDEDFVPEKSGDDLESIKVDSGMETQPIEESKKEESPSPVISTEVQNSEKAPAVFDVGREERELLALSQNIQGQISDPEWNEVATATKVETYTVVKNDWLFKISKRLFGSGNYYPKIWSLNSFITNPHFIEPGIILSFTTGSSSQAPEVKLGTFSESELQAEPGTKGSLNPGDLANFGDEVGPEWLNEKSVLEKQGVYFQYASEETIDDLNQVSEKALNREYENYSPPVNDFDVVVPKNYDSTGFDVNSKIYYSIKEGFYLSTFLSTNIVQDFGSITDGSDENVYFTTMDKAYVKFDDTMNVVAGDLYSIYSTSGKVTHPKSDREGYKYSIVGQIKLIRKIKNKWEVEFIEVTGTPQRGDRITVYTPKIERITRTYNSRLIEAGILASYEPGKNVVGFGDVVYLDRGRADGVEMGNVFEVFGFKDLLTGKNITDQPTYELGELTVITLTDNFATAIITKSKRDFSVGDIAITKTKEAHLRDQKAKLARSHNGKETLGGKNLEELDVELNLDDLNDDLLKKADKIQLTEDELAELERQEREKSVIKDSEKDLKALERLENEIEHAESILNDAKLDEDKLLEDQNLNEVEKKNEMQDQESLDDIEENLGKRYIDEELNSKDNPFGLTEFDVEEVDELLNTEAKEKK